MTWNTISGCANRRGNCYRDLAADSERANELLRREYSVPKVNEGDEEIGGGMLILVATNHDAKGSHNLVT